MTYIDIHTHKLLCNNDTLSVFNQRLNSAVEKKNAYSIGLHPWNITSENDIHIIDEITADKNLYFIGECGFDKNIAVPYKVQEAIFIRQAEMSEKIHKPLIIHCVGYFNEIIILAKQLKHVQKWIIHGFTGHSQLASQLLNAGFMLSFGKALFHTGRKAIETFRTLPLNSFFLETDESNYSIQEVYQQACLLRQTDEHQLKKQITDNFKKLYQ